MAFTCLKELGTVKQIGKSLFDTEGAKHVQNIMKSARMHNVAIVFPVDFRCASSRDSKNCTTINAEDGIPADQAGFDIGPESEKVFAKVLEGAKKVLWNGPMGVFENPVFSHGTAAVLASLKQLTRQGAITVVGGGDSAAAVQSLGALDDVVHVSTGGGASLELLEGKELPGIAHLSDK